MKGVPSITPIEVKQKNRQTAQLASEMDKCKTPAKA